MNLNWKVLSGAILLAGLAVGCGGHRVSTSGQDAARSQEIALDEWVAEVVIEPPLPDLTARERAKIVRLALDDAAVLFQEGHVHFSNGERELGRLYFREALDALTGSGFDSPELEQRYEDLSSAILRIEVLAQIAPSESPFLLDQYLAESLSPLDQIADLDLYAVEVDPALEGLVSEEIRRIPFDFPVVVNEQVLKMLEYFHQGRGRGLTEEALQRSGRYLPLFRKIFQEEGLPLDLIYMAHTESLFKPRAYSRAHARGIWQFVAGTGRLYGLDVSWWLDERLDVVKATRAAARHLRDLKAEFGDWYLALAAYNGGPGRVARVRRRHGDLDYWTMARRGLLPRETRNYVPSILAAIIIYRMPETFGFTVIPDPPLEFEEVQVTYQVDLEVIAEELGFEADQLKDLNPELQRGITPDVAHNLKVPVGAAEQVRFCLASLPEEKRLRFKHHKVRQGETLSHIAARYGVSIRAIADVNRLRNIHRLRLGQDLTIPLSGGAPGSGGGVLASASTSGGNYVVRRGDSLYRIARRHGLRLTDLFRWNNLQPGDVIHPGQEIRLVGE